MKNKYEIRGDITAIFLNRKDGTVIETIIDTDSLERAMEYPHSWYARYDPAMKKYYVGGSLLVGGIRKSIIFTRWLTNAPEGLVVDHFDHDTLNNRMSNLRVVSHAHNMQNRRTKRKNLYSGFRGVTWDKTSNAWISSFSHKGKRYFCGSHDTLEAAVRAVSIGRAKLLPFSEDATRFTGEEDNVLPSKERPSRGKSHRAPKGVYWHKKEKKWNVIIIRNKKRFSFGSYADYDVACRVAKEKHDELDAM